MTSAIEVIERARRLVELLPERRPSAKTAQQYRACATRVLRESGSVELLRPTDSRSTYYYRRAALHWFAARALRKALAHAEKLPEGPALDAFAESLAAALDRVEPALEVDPPEYQALEHLNAGRRSRWTDDHRERAGNRRRPTATKRSMLSILPANWREQLWAAVPPRSPYRNAIAVMILVGPRPAEFVPGPRHDDRQSEGVLVTGSPDGRLLTITVDGVKCDDEWKGQPVRSALLDVELEGPAAAHLARCLEPGASLVVAASSADALRKAVARIGRRAFPLLPAITPVLLRHAFLADAKATFSAGEDVAAGAGHASAASQSRYGHRQSGRRRPGLLALSGSRPVRGAGKLEAVAELGERRRTAIEPEPPPPAPRYDKPEE